MNIYLISDCLTAEALSYESGIRIQTSRFSFFQERALSRCDLLLVESAWQGYKNSWKYKIAAYPDVPKRNNNSLLRLLEKAKKKGIPTVFWNKEDGVHFDRFIDSAKHFDHIFTVDQNCIARYKSIVPASTTVNVAMFPIQPRIHNSQAVRSYQFSANFVGSYSSHIHSLRRDRQHLLFRAANKAGLPLTIFDRNSDRKSTNYRYPSQQFDFQLKPKISYVETANVYRNHLISLNVNTVEDSPTMFSRRVVEVLACSGILVSTPSMAMEHLFKDYCHIVYSEEQAQELFERLKYGATKHDIEMARAGADFVQNNFTWKKFLTRVQETINLR